MPTWQVVLLGLIEGLTEFIPVSSTGHVLLAGHFLGFESPQKTFEILIQLGAILAILTVYAARLWRLALDLTTDPRARRFVLGILLAFLARRAGRRGAAFCHQAGAVRVALADLLDADPRRLRAAGG